MHKVFTYYEGFDFNLRDDQQQMIEHWRRSWAKQGWNPVVLSVDDARRNPMFREFDEACRLLPTVNRIEYELACYRRWMAVATAGGGFMSDYDVVNYGFKPSPPEADLVIYETNTEHGTVIPSVVGGTAYGFIQACLAFTLSDPNSITSQEEGKPHASDMIAMQMTASKRIYNAAPRVVQYGHDGWDEAQLVHYSHVTTCNTDRVRCMQTARSL